MKYSQFQIEALNFKYFFQIQIFFFQIHTENLFKSSSKREISIPSEIFDYSNEKILISNGNLQFLR